MAAKGAIQPALCLCMPKAQDRSALAGRSLNQLRKELAHKLAAKAEQDVEPVPAGLHQEESDYDMSPASAAPRATLSPRVRHRAAML